MNQDKVVSLIVDMMGVTMKIALPMLLVGLIDAPPTVTVPMHATLADLEPVKPKGFINALRSKTVVK